jgi:hypothetical protein
VYRDLAYPHLTRHYILPRIYLCRSTRPGGTRGKKERRTEKKEGVDIQEAEDIETEEEM